MSNEELNISINEQGLLENVNVVADNQTAKIITSVVNAPSGILKLKSQFTSASLEDQPVLTIKEIEVSKMFKLDAWETFVEKLITWSFFVNPDESGKDAELIPCEASFIVHSNIKNVTGVPATPGAAEAPGLLFRPKSAVAVTLMDSKREQSIVIDGFNFVNKSHIYSVPIRSNPFVARKHNVGVKNGELISHRLTNPSSVLGFIMIPIELAKAIVSIPAQLISFRVDTLSRKRDLEAARNSLTEETIKSQELEVKIREMKLKEDEVKELQLKNKAEKLEAEEKIQKLKANVSQIKVNSAMEILRLQKEIAELKKNG